MEPQTPMPLVPATAQPTPGTLVADTTSARVNLGAVAVRQRLDVAAVHAKALQILEPLSWDSNGSSVPELQASGSGGMA